MEGIEKALSIGYEIVGNNIRRYKKRRYLFRDFEKSAKNKNEITEVIGLRGAGKTVMISQFLEGKEYSYLSMNYPPLAGLNLYEMLEYIVVNKNPEYIVLDEFQHSGDFESLKIFFDSYKGKVKLIITGSSSLALKRADRRIKVLELKPFSFREYLFFKHDIKEEKLKFEEIMEGKGKELIMYEKYLSDYYEKALPFLLEGGDSVSLIESILRKDLPVFRKIDEKNIREIEKLMYFIANPLGEFSFSSASKTLGIAKSQIKRYVELLREAMMLIEIEPHKKGFLKEAKYYYRVPLRSILLSMSGKRVERGILYEEFFVNHLENIGIKFISGKGKPDFLIRGKSFEVGGRAKGKEQGADKLVIAGRTAGKGELPLIAFGFLY